jgi:hypothetical protein
MKPPPRGTDSSEKTKIGAVSCPSPATPEARRAGFGLLAPEHAGCRHLEGTDQTLTGDACAHAQRSREACRRPSRTSRRSSPTTTRVLRGCRTCSFDAAAESTSRSKRTPSIAARKHTCTHAARVCLPWPWMSHVHQHSSSVSGGRLCAHRNASCELLAARRRCRRICCTCCCWTRRQLLAADRFVHGRGPWPCTNRVAEPRRDPAPAASPRERCTRYGREFGPYPLLRWLADGVRSRMFPDRVCVVHVCSTGRVHGEE